MIVSELAQRSGLAPHVVRYYARIGLLSPRRNPGNGYKVFSRDDLTRVRFIRKAQSLGFTLDEIQEILSIEKNARVPCPMVREILEKRILENRRQVEILCGKQRRMEAALALWKTTPDQDGDSLSICHLIEQTEDFLGSA